MFKLGILNKFTEVLKSKMVKSLNDKLFVIASIGVICSILPMVSAAVLGLTSPPGPEHKCMMKSCQVERLEEAAKFLSERDATVEPCDNFFKHVCGNYEESFENFIEESLRVHLIDRMIAAGPDTDDQSKAHRLVHDLYQSCIDDNSRGEKSLKLLESLVHTQGQCPIMEGEKWNEANFDWIDFISNTKKAGYTRNILLGWKPQKEFDGQNHTLTYHLHMPSTFFDKAIDPKNLARMLDYKDFMLKAGQLLGAPDENLAKYMQDAFEFEYKLYEISKDDDSSDAKPMTIEEMQKEWPTFDWATFIEKTLTPFIDDGDKPVMTVMNSTTLTEFIKLMENTPKRVQGSYIVWKIIQYSMPYLTKDLIEADEKFHESIEHLRMPRKEYCADMVKKYAGVAIDDLYLDHFESSKAALSSMFETIKEKMINMIKESKVLSEDDKKQGTELLEEMKHTIGRSDLLVNDEDLDEFYMAADVQKDNMLQTILNMNLFRMKKKNSNKLRSDMFQYFPMKSLNSGLPDNYLNHVYIPVTMIPSQSFNIDRPMYLNFGSGGSFMAREMFRSLMHIGRKWSEDGKELPGDQIDCYSNMLDNITDTEMKKNLAGESLETAGESLLAVHIGIRAAYLAYKQSIASGGPELGLPEVEYTPEQLFWMSFIQPTCRDMADDRLMSGSSDNSNTNHLDFMIMFLLKNIPEISADFECPVGSNLNPEKKCTWW